MKEHPILFSGPMVRAILDGRKTQTRRVVKPQLIDSVIKHRDQWLSASHVDNLPLDGTAFRCPYGSDGDRLWVRETYCVRDIYDDDKPSILPSSPECACLHYMADGPKQSFHGKTRPGIFMPRWAYRIGLEINGIRLQRLQEINEEDSLSEGVDKSRCGQEGYAMDPIYSYRTGFVRAWNLINGKTHPWSNNPWVWAITFKAL